MWRMLFSKNLYASLRIWIRNKHFLSEKARRLPGFPYAILSCFLLALSAYIARSARVVNSSISSP